jgi:aminodeoxyfutalosine deaminase
MGYRKIQADGLFDGEKIVGGGEQGPVLICSDDGVIENIVHGREAGEGIERHPGLLCPGFINTHCHLELSHMKGVIPSGTGLVDFLLQVMERREEAPADPFTAAREADRQMAEEGIVAVGDISNNISTLPIKAASKLYYHTFVEVTGFIPSGAEARLQQARQTYLGMSQVLGEHCVSLVPHAPYSVSRPLFDALNQSGKGRVLTIHNQESEAENELYKDKEGDFLRLYAILGLDLAFFTPYRSSSLPAYLPWLTEPAALILVHNVATAPSDVDGALALAESRGQSIYWCLCPGANIYIQGRMPPVTLLREKKCVLTLGTDSLSSNRQLSILAEMRLLQENDPAIPLAEILSWATANGARALGIAERFGSFRKGTQPGILLIRDLAGERFSPKTTIHRLF